MRIQDARFVTSVPAGGRLPADTPPIVAMVGRSNVGKSSLINALTGQRIARAGAKPGTTRMVNLYAVRTATAGARSRRLTLADLPGYGFARGGATARREFDALTRSFFRRLVRDPEPVRGPDETRLAGAILVVDGRHPGLESDLAALAWLLGLGPPVAVVATKNDRQSGNAQRALRSRHERALERPVLPVSSKTGAGVPAVRAAVGAMLTAANSPSGASSSRDPSTP